MGYLGSKLASGAYQAIIAHMPPHDTYIETHLGGGAIMKKKPQSIRSIGIDKDSEALANLQCTYDVELHQDDATAFLQSFDFENAGRTLIYADPPYLHSTRTSRARYKHEYSDQDHIDLITTLKDLPANVILSGYASSLYDDLLADWHTMSFQINTRGGVRTEQLWFNFEPNAAHWCTYAGKDYTDRQRIKRKAQRWAENYKALPVPEQQAILAALLQSQAGSIGGIAA